MRGRVIGQGPRAKPDGVSRMGNLLGSDHLSRASNVKSNQFLEQARLWGRGYSSSGKTLQQGWGTLAPLAIRPARTSLMICPMGTGE